MAHGVAAFAPSSCAPWSRTLAWLRDRDRPLLAAMLALHLAPLCLVPWFPTRDGPTHLEGALMLLRYHQPAGAALREWFTLELPLAPNWLDHVLLAAFAQVAPPMVGEKILVALFVAGLPLAARRAFEAIQPGAGFLAVLIFPFTYTWLLHMGFYNFCLSLPLFFLALASFLHYRARPGGRRLAGLCGWATVLYFAHPVSWCAAAVLLPLLAGCFTLHDLLSSRRLGLPLRYALRRGLALCGCALAAFAPAAVLLLRFVAGQRSPGYERFPVRQLIGDLARLDVLVTFDPVEAMLAAALALVLACLAAGGAWTRWRTRRAATGDVFLLAVGVFLAAYLFAPVALVGGQYLTPRLMLYPVFALLLWLATIPWEGWMRTAVGTAAIAVTVPSLAAHAGRYRDANELLGEYLSAEPWIAEGATVLPLHYSGPDDHGFPRVDVFAHAAAYMASSRGAIDLVFYEGTTRGIFPMAFRRELNPYRHLDGNPESVPPCVDLASYRQRTGHAIDYVLTWKQQKRDRVDECSERALHELRNAYAIVHTSQPRELMKVWRRLEETP